MAAFDDFRFQWKRWALTEETREVVGIGDTVADDPERANDITIFVRDGASPDLDGFLRKNLPNISFQLVRTGAFQLLSNSIQAGSEIAVSSGSGRAGAVLVDNSGARYALTCAHVLDVAVGVDVFGKGGKIGEVSHKIELDRSLPSLSPSDPLEPNTVDCALARLNPDVTPIATAITKAPAPLKSGILIGGAVGAPATVVSNRADIVCEWFHQGRTDRIFFDDVTVASTCAMVRPGDSGSPVEFDGALTGMLFAGPPLIPSGPSGPGTPISGAGLAFCDIGKVIRALTKAYPELMGLRLFGAGERDVSSQ